MAQNNPLPPVESLAPPMFLIRSLNDRQWFDAATLLRQNTTQNRVIAAVHFSRLLDIDQNTVVVGAWIFMLQRNEGESLDRISSYVDKYTALRMQGSVNWGEFSFDEQLFEAAEENVKQQSVHREELDFEQ